MAKTEYYFSKDDFVPKILDKPRPHLAIATQDH